MKTTWINKCILALFAAHTKIMSNCLWQRTFQPVTLRSRSSISWTSFWKIKPSYVENRRHRW